MSYSYTGTSLTYVLQAVNHFEKVCHVERPVASFTTKVYLRLAKRPLVFNGRLDNRGLTSLVKEATGNKSSAIL